MKKETDLGGVKAIAKTLLMTAVNQTPYSPMLVQHPFTSSGLVALPTDTQEQLALTQLCGILFRFGQGAFSNAEG